MVTDPMPIEGVKGLATAGTANSEENGDENDPVRVIICFPSRRMYARTYEDPRVIAREVRKDLMDSLLWKRTPLCTECSGTYEFTALCPRCELPFCDKCVFKWVCRMNKVGVKIRCNTCHAAIGLGRWCSLVGAAHRDATGIPSIWTLMSLIAEKSELSTKVSVIDGKNDTCVVDVIVPPKAAGKEEAEKLMRALRMMRGELVRVYICTQGSKDILVADRAADGQWVRVAGVVPFMKAVVGVLANGSSRMKGVA